MMLRGSGFGCRIDNCYTGEFYADDITLSCPSIRGINRMLFVISWHFNSPDIRRICTTWNIKVHTVLKLPFNTLSHFLRALLGQNHIRQQLQGVLMLF